MPSSLLARSFAWFVSRMLLDGTVERERVGPESGDYFVDEFLNSRWDL